MDASPITVVIVDDELLARQRLRVLLQASEGIDIIGEYGDAETAARAINERPPDLLFLDVQMPGRNGFDLLTMLEPAQVPVVVFVTAYDRYAVNAFKVSALDYLLKPFDLERFQAVLERARAEIARERGGDLSRRWLALLQSRDRESKYLERIKVKAGEGFQFLRTREIDYIESEANYLRIHAGKNSYLVRGTIGAVEQLLDPHYLVRIHRSTIVNVDSIREMHPWFQNGEYALTMKDGKQLTISRGYRDRLSNLARDFG